MSWHRAARLTDIPADGRGGLPVTLAGRSIALFRYDGRVFAIRNVCPHAGDPLDAGFVDDFLLECPSHGWTFPLIPERQGMTLISATVDQFPCEVRDGAVFVEVG